MIIDIKDINIVLVVVIIVLVIVCLIRNEHFVDGVTLQPLPTTCGVESNDPYAEINTFHPNEEGGAEVNPNNYMFAITNTDNKQIYGLGSSRPEPKTVPVPANSGE